MKSMDAKPIGRTGGSESASRSLQPIQFYSGANETGKFRSNQLKIALQSREAELLFALLGDAKRPDEHQDIKRPPVRGGVGSSESASPFFVFRHRLAAVAKNAVSLSSLNLVQ